MFRVLILLGLLMLTMATHAKQWTIASELSGAKVATSEEKVLWRKRLASMQIHYNFEDRDFLIYRGDLTIDGNFDSNTLLIVDGNLLVKGFYNDYRDDIGVLVVTGSMTADRLYSWGALYVEKDLNVAQLALSVYNDFTFEVGGKVNARALVLSDKSADYTAGKLDVELNDMSDDSDARDAAIRHFVPEVFTQTGHFESEMDDDFYGLSFDDGYALARMAEGVSVFRAREADKSLPADVNRVMQSGTSEKELLELMRKDLLLAQLIATRPELSDELANALLRLKDPTINEWLASSKPELVHAQSGGEITPKLAQSLAENPDVQLTTLQAIGSHASPQVRAALAKHQALADSAAGRALTLKLLNDPDASVRAAILNAFAYVSAFGLDLQDAQIDKLINDSKSEVIDALANVHLNFAQANALLPKLGDEARAVFAESLRDQVLQLRPTRMQRAEQETLARGVLAVDNSKNYFRANTAALMVLPDAEQITQFNRLLAAKQLSLDGITRETRSVSVIRAIAALGMEHSKMIPSVLASNEYMPQDLQLHILQLARTAKAKADDDYGDHPIDALENLLSNDAAVPAVILGATELALSQGLNPSDGGFQNALFHNKLLPPEAIVLLDAKLKHDEDWALTLMLQEHASVAQKVRALKRWYDDDGELQTSLKGAENLSESEFFAACARSDSMNLQGIAAEQKSLPLDLVKVLQQSSFEDIAQATRMHPQIPLADLDLGLFTKPDDIAYAVRHDAKDWLALSERLTSMPLRAAAYRKYGEALSKTSP